MKTKREYLAFEANKDLRNADGFCWLVKGTPVAGFVVTRGPMKGFIKRVPHNDYIDPKFLTPLKGRTTEHPAITAAKRDVATKRRELKEAEAVLEFMVLRH